VTIRSQTAKLVGKATQKFLKMATSGGSSLPGQVALKIDNDILDYLSKDYHVVMITGTNGKTLTTAMIVNILKQKFDYVLTNPTGANLKQGIVSTFLADSAPKGASKIAVLEIDEATLASVTEVIKPTVIVYTNVFRDQMDRYGEIYTIYQMMVDGALKAPEATVIANGDSPIFNSVDMPNPKKYFGFNTTREEDVPLHPNTDGVLCPKCDSLLHYHLNTYSNLGDYYCPKCGFKRPPLDYSLDKLLELTLKESKFVVDGHPYEIQIGGRYNIYNALAAYSVGRFFEVNPDQIQAGFYASKRVFGRQEELSINGKSVLMNLTKNPVGLNEVIELLHYENEPFTLITLLNDNYADGQDVSWIWDGDYEKFATVPNLDVYYGGKRPDEMHLRLEVAGIPEERLHKINSFEDIATIIGKVKTPKVHILATYTAVLSLRKIFKQQGFIKEVK